MKKIYLSGLVLMALFIFILINKEEPTVADRPIYKENPKSESKIDIARKIDELMRTDANGDINYTPGYQYIELQKLKKNSANNAKISSDLDWIERGPRNVGGRTRHILVDVADPTLNTWLAGSAGGGIWKTTNAGVSWTNVTTDAPNLSVCTIAQSEDDPSIMYAGTGEGALGGTNGNGSGILKSTDGGDTWSLLANTSPANSDDFWNVNEIIMDPNDAQTIIAATSNGKYGQSFRSAIMKSTDGGANWSTIYSPNSRAQQIIADPNDFNTMYVSLILLGVAKTTDGGANWDLTSLNEVASNFSPERTELAISPSDPNKIYASMSFANRSGSGVFYSDDKGETWTKVEDQSALEQIDFLVQGEYNNSITVHPTNPFMVFVGGVNMYRLDVKEGEIEEGQRQFLSAEEIDTESFLSFVSFSSGTHYDGRLSIVNEFTTPNIEVRYGPGKAQKAHRFTVPTGSTAGVPASDYSYQDYVEVPFEIWDVDNNRQLMVSFRDQEADGKFNLNEAAGDQEEANNREYIYINDVTYDANNPNSSIAVSGGHEFSNLIFYWPTLTPGGVWDDTALPESTFKINFGKSTTLNTDVTQVSDFDKIHSDHHYLTFVTLPNDTDRLFSCNDGGVGYSDNLSVSYTNVELDYNTSQFYAAVKQPGENAYLGGTQDNEVLRSGVITGSAPTTFNRATPGQIADGFEVLYHGNNDQRLMASNQRNVIFRSEDGGFTWENTFDNLTDAGFDNTDAPFYTKLGYSVNGPAVVFAVSNSGVWKTIDFGDTWELKAINSKWGGFLDIEVSDADPNIVWAGGNMSSNGNIFVSTDRGETFNAVNNFATVPEIGNITTIVPDPLDADGAYVLFSQVDGPKILKTTDLGQTWTDISGFDDQDESSNGFPDVATQSLVAFPDGTTIWAGTEIGLVESTDAGASWHWADNGLPAVMLWDLKLLDGQVVAATHGRGIWSVEVDQFYSDQLVLSTQEAPSFATEVYPNPASTTLQIELGAELKGNAIIKLISSDGKMALEREISNSGSVSLDVSTLKRGAYVLYIKNNAGSKAQHITLY